MGTLWRVLRVKSSCEKKTATDLTARLIENYLPLVSQRKQWTDRIVMTSRTLSPGYVFARFTATQRQLVLSAPGVVMNGLGEAISERELKQMCAAFDQGYQLEPHLGEVKGNRVRFRKGMFAATVGVAVACGAGVKIVMEQPMREQLFAVRTDLNDIEVVDGAAGGFKYPDYSLASPRDLTRVSETC